MHFLILSTDDVGAAGNVGVGWGGGGGGAMKTAVTLVFRNVAAFPRAYPLRSDIADAGLTKVKCSHGATLGQLFVCAGASTGGLAVFAPSRRNTWEAGEVIKETGDGTGSVAGAAAAAARTRRAAWATYFAWGMCMPPTTRARASRW